MARKTSPGSGASQSAPGNVSTSRNATSNAGNGSSACAIPSASPGHGRSSVTCGGTPCDGFAAHVRSRHSSTAAARSSNGTISACRVTRRVATATTVVRSAGCKPSHPGVLGRANSCGYSRSLRPWAARFSLGRPGTYSRPQPLADGRADVDDALVLDRHERRADLHDHALDVAEHLVTAVLARHDDPDLVLRRRFEAVLLQQHEELVAVGNPCRGDLDRPCHLGSEVSSPRRTTSNGNFPSMAVTAGSEVGLFIDGEVAEAASGDSREL